MGLMKFTGWPQIWAGNVADLIELTQDDWQRLYAGDLKLARRLTEEAPEEHRPELRAMLAQSKLLEVFTELRDFNLRRPGVDRVTHARRELIIPWGKRIAPVAYAYHASAEMVDAVNEFTRTKMREDGFYRRILPPVPITNDEFEIPHAD